MANYKDTNDTDKALNCIYIVTFQVKMLVVIRKCCNQNAGGGILLYRHFHSHFFDKTNLSVGDRQAEWIIYCFTGIITFFDSPITGTRRSDTLLRIPVISTHS